jgi:hypothetical protein
MLRGNENREMIGRMFFSVARKALSNGSYSGGFIGCGAVQIQIE